MQQVVKVVIEPYTVGQAFATTARLRAVVANGRKGRVVAEVGLYPYGFRAAAVAAAEALAAKLGYTVAR